MCTSLTRYAPSAPRETAVADMDYGTGQAIEPGDEVTLTSWSAHRYHMRGTVTRLVEHWDRLLVEVTWHQHPHEPPGHTSFHVPGRLSLLRR